MATNNKSFMAKPGEVESRWFVVDATDLVLGRLASQVASILKGKNKPEYTPNVDCGDHVIIINCANVRLSGNKLGIWVAHGEGNFRLPKSENEYNIVAKYNYSGYPANPNGSTYDVAGLASADGRHLAMMPHLERAIFPWQQAYYPADRRGDEITPWVEAFVNARKWIEGNK